jgi:hypothetical protein
MAAVFFCVFISFAAAFSATGPVGFVGKCGGGGDQGGEDKKSGAKSDAQ